MAFIPTLNAARVAIRYDLFGQDVVNTLWFLFSGETITSTDTTALALFMQQWAKNELLPGLSIDMKITDVTATAQDSLTSPSSVVPDGTSAGGINNPSLPGGSCVTIKFNTGFRGRSGRGRNYISGLYETGVLGNQVGNTIADNILNAYQLLILDGPDFWTWVVVSHYVDHAPREFGLTQLVTSCQIPDRNIDSQRRRLTGRGS